MGEIIPLLVSLKEIPATVTIGIAIMAMFITMWLRVKDADVQSATSLSKIQNEKLIALMNQNEKLLDSVSTLQTQVQTLHQQMNDEAEEHRKKLEQTYRSIDEMRVRISELEELVRHYQSTRNQCTVANCEYRKP